jgi:hypothetical protein
MADTWGEWLGGSPEQRLADLEAQRREFDATRATPLYQALYKRADRPVDTPMHSYDPREMRMAMVQSQLAPRRTSDASNAVAAAVDYGLDFGGRMRDTAFTAAAAASQGDGMRAARLTALAPLAGLLPSMGAGMRGQPDDWREIAKQNGVSPDMVLFYDAATDPENWITSPLKAPLNMIVPGVGMRMAGMAGRYGDDLAKAAGRVVDMARYGSGSPAYLMDEAGEVIRRLRSAQ